MKVNKFIQQVIEECIKYKITLIFSNTDKVCSKNEDPAFASAGYFSDQDKELVVASHSYRWIEMLVHEYSHFCQWKERKFFANQNWVDKQNSFWLWLEGRISLSNEDLDEVIDAAVSCEIDCERRAVKTLSKLSGYRARIRPYIKTANTYLYFYGLVRELRKWFIVIPSSSNRIYSFIPDKYIITAEEAMEPKPEHKELLLKLYGNLTIEG